MNEQKLNLVKKPVVFVIIGIVILIYFLNSNSTISSNDSSYYLTSPWITERVDWFFLSLPEEWSENNTEIRKSQSQYDEISNDARMYEMILKDFYLICAYVDFKDGYHESWDMDKSAVAVINQALHKLNCHDLKMNKLSPDNNNNEIYYYAQSTCSPENYTAKLKGMKYENHLIMVCLYYKQSDNNSELIANRIIEGIENKYADIKN